ncbi:uncharacterized protein FOBCDRAFT_149608 [Fusarium oxysporum Fo47]|uniref:uncharacterized protein n=1 Tax=Fusarium oxysporum Fo47 TaxID=660027 RepID=UPI002869D19D|nr:uncharacterized protein FOBCDRAFT_149608 [Fusarium oxysporum Fo47]QKD62351.2 hypothetical protein FOBCDRAFT_149608 [Fusarium oxysporum Fo47]
MRFTLFCAAALAASPAFASVCKPRSLSGSTTASVESAISSLPSATSTELQTTVTGTMTATSADLLSTTATSTSNDDSTTEAATTAATTSPAETTDLEASTTTAEATTSEAAFEPVPTFDVVGKGAQVDDVNGNILCIQYGEDGDASLLRTCDNNMLNQPDYAPVTCEQTRDQELDCSVPAKTCTLDFDTLETICTTLTGTFDNFYTYSGRQDGIFLSMAGVTNPGANYQAVVLAITPSGSK